MKNVYNDAWPDDFPKTRKPSFLRNILAYLCYRHLSQKAELYTVPRHCKSHTLFDLEEDDKASLEDYILDDLGLYDLMGKKTADELFMTVLHDGNAYGFWKAKNQKDGFHKLHFLNDVLNLNVRPTRAPSAANNRNKRQRDG
jgi:hypothetical protein